MTSSHRWRRARITDPEYGRICACGDLKDQQALRCRSCYAVERRNEERRTCDCGNAKNRGAIRCMSCADEAKRGVPCPTGAQPWSHPWRKPIVRRAA